MKVTETGLKNKSNKSSYTGGVKDKCDRNSLKEKKRGGDFFVAAKPSSNLYLPKETIFSLNNLFKLSWIMIIHN